MDRSNLGRLRFSARLLSRRVWQRRIVFWLGALLVGLAGIVFAELSNWAQSVSSGFFAAVWWAPLLVTPAGFLACTWLALTLAPASAGSGIPQAMAARDLRNARARTVLLGPRVVLAKIGLTVVGLLSGASIGREGPTVQIGAGIMLQVARWGNLQQERGLILAGSAAGIAGAFNTPLAGIVFAIEEMSRAFEQRTNGLVLYAVIIAGLASIGIVGDYSYFGTTSATVAEMRDWITVFVVGILGGVTGGAFSRILLSGSRFIAAWSRPTPIGRRLLIAGACGLAVALIGLGTDGATFGTGYEQARAAVEGHPTAEGYWLGKFATTLITALSGIPGGIFAPSLSVGAGLGDWLGALIGTRGDGLAAVLGMAGYFAGVVQSPMTAFVIIMEMTNNQSNIIPLMVASILGYASSRFVAPEPLYGGLARSFLQRRPAGAKSETAAKPDVAAKPEASAKHEKPAKPEAAAKPEVAAKPAAAPGSEAAAKPETAAKPAAAAKPDAP